MRHFLDRNHTIKFLAQFSCSNRVKRRGSLTFTIAGTIGLAGGPDPLQLKYHQSQKRDKKNYRIFSFSFF